MTKAVLQCCLWALPWLVVGVSGVRAQTGEDLLDDEYGDDYDAYFGGGEEGQKQDGPESLEEARKQGRGYRIGSGGVYTPSSGKDTHVVREGDTLWDISQHYFGDPWQWPKLWSYNPEVTNPHWIYPMDQLRLSPGALQQDVAVAKAVTGKGTGTGLGMGRDDVTPGMLSGTEQAPSVIVPGRMFQKPGTIFLRDEAYLDQDALKTVGQIVGGHEEHMFLSPSDQVYVRFKEGQDVRAGQSYAIFRPIHAWERDPGEDEEQGTLVRIQGTVVVRSYDRERKVARGVLTEAMDPIERGFFVARVDRRFDLVEPQRNESNVVARIVASSRPRELLSYGEVVFLDVGQGHGIKPGNRFFVVRRGDDWLDTIVADPTELGNIVEVPEYDPTVLPKEVVAELRVLKVRKTTTIALVTRSDYDVLQGEVAEMRVGF
jgi:hypothetical protein